MLPGGTRIVCTIYDNTYFLGLICTILQIPAQPLTTADEELNDLDHDLSVDDLSEV